MTTGEQPLTRRQAREAERSQSAASSSTPQPSRRAVVPEPTTGGDAPQLAIGFPASSDALAGAAENEYEARAARPAVATAAPTTPLITSPPLTSVPPASFATPADALRPSSFAPTDAAPLTDHANTAEAAPERTLTRRELRALLAEQEATETQTDIVAVIQSPAESPAVPTVAEGGRRATWTPPADEELAQRPVWAPTPLPGPVAEPSLAEAVPAEPVLAEPVPAEIPLARPDVDDTGSHKPIGHWSVESDHDTDPRGMQPQTFDQLLARGSAVGGVPTTTNALILPAVPTMGDAPSGTVNTGETLITGSFDLPRSFGSTGAHPDRIDSSDIDRLFEAEDAAPSTGAQPIRASRAVSSHTATRDVIKPPTKEKRWSAPFVLSLSAGVLAVGVIGLTIAGFVSGIF